MDAVKVLSIIALTLVILLMVGIMSTTSCVAGATLGKYYAENQADQTVNTLTSSSSGTPVLGSTDVPPSDTVESLIY